MDKTKKLEAFIVYLCETCRQLDEFQHRLMHMQVCHLIIIIMTFNHHNHQLNTIILLLLLLFHHHHLLPHHQQS
jgi:hypothetical protein